MTMHRNIAVIGAGLMGHGIALTFARAGHTVCLFDPVSDVLASVKERVDASLTALGVEDTERQQTLQNISCANSMKQAVVNATVVVEAAPEKLELKQKLFAEIEKHAPPDAILASNTSVIPITKIMQGLNGKHRAVGTHWWNPPHMIPLVEVVKTEWTESKFADDMFNLLTQSGKTPVMVEKDIPGFIGNRLQHALWREAISLVENGVCDARSVDTVIKSSFGRRLSVLGPLENADLVGTDLTLDIHENVLFDLESKAAPSAYLEQLVSEKKLGMKSGEGFSKWSEQEANEVRNRVAHHLKELEKIL